MDRLDVEMRPEFMTQGARVRGHRVELDPDAFAVGREYLITFDEPFGPGGVASDGRNLLAWRPAYAGALR
jgi:hypothetical protein